MILTCLLDQDWAQVLLLQLDDLMDVFLVKTLISLSKSSHEILDSMFIVCSKRRWGILYNVNLLK